MVTPSPAGGSVGVLAGGLVTDLLKRRMGPHSRLWIQVGQLTWHLMDK